MPRNSSTEFRGESTIRGTTQIQYTKYPLTSNKALAINAAHASGPLRTGGSRMSYAHKANHGLSPAARSLTVSAMRLVPFIAF